MDLRTGIIETANALGMDPAWLAAIISYETGGTFNPTQVGPTTQWGQHRGLIQFGEPQAREYGVDWSDPLGSQLGPNGAVANYFRRNGWQPGMDFANAYSIVNAGAPGRLNASDANNGGAPGTVLDKVQNQFGGHWANAERLLGGNFTFPGLAPTAAADALTFGGGEMPEAPPQTGLMAALAAMHDNGATEMLASGLMGRMAAPQMLPQVMAPQIAAAQRANPYTDFFARLRNG
jgi:hypothetical protein